MIGRRPRAQQGTRVKPESKQGRGIATWLCWSFLFVAVGRLGELIPGAGSLPIAKVLVAAWAAAIILSTKRPSPIVGLYTGVLKAGLALFVLAILSIPFSVWPGGSVHTFLSNILVIGVSLILLCATLTTDRAIVGTLKCLTLSACMLITVALATSAGGRIAVESMYDTNDLAYTVVSVIPICIGLAELASGTRRVFFGVCAMLLVAGSLLTQSRGALVAMAALVVFFVLSAGRSGVRRAADGRQPTSRAKVVVIAVLALATAYVVLPKQAIERFATLEDVQSDYNMDEKNRNGRLSVWQRNIQATLDRPIGYGLGSAPMVDLRRGGTFTAAHNSLIQIAVELGVIGLALFLLLYVFAWRQLSHYARSAAGPVAQAHAQVLSRALRGSLVANFVAGFFLSQAYSSTLWTILGIISIITAQRPQGQLALPPIASELESSAAAKARSRGRQAADRTTGRERI